MRLEPLFVVRHPLVLALMVVIVVILRSVGHVDSEWWHVNVVVVVVAAEVAVDGVDTVTHLHWHKS
jgi:hypothetical protein